MNKYSLTLLLSTVIAVTACNEEQKITKTEQPKIEQANAEQTQKKSQIILEKQSVNSDQEFAKNEEVTSLPQSSSALPEKPSESETNNKEKEYDQKVEDAKQATLNAANKLADVMGTKMEQVTEQLADTINQIDVNKATEQLADKINGIDINKVTEPLKKQIDKFGQFMEKLEESTEQPQQEDSKQQPKTKFEEGYL
ncbi:Uncharacterised protein [Phocoenobacter uteri]|uniref:Lipoprotein n=1 Tax=Phocoenobacter uteri TaxID=146806 RepID=A0A379C8Q7_9PAST|nr:hypothetical protein [Phocoenobacter uteri]MDG6881986.1 hypothetical protein [Phocoenobacter uteri]SUB58135.1 Uncharacterised protein [Phocoenobacter uteri]